MRYLLIILSTCIMQFDLYGQKTEMGSSRHLSIESFVGRIHDHSPFIPTNLIEQFTSGFLIRHERHTYGTNKWEAAYNYPDVGYSFLYVNYDKDEIGRTYSVIPHISFYLNKNHHKKSDLKLTLGFGGAYHSNPYNAERNERNVLLGSRFSFAVHGQFAYYHHFGDRIVAKAGITFNHFSNGAIKKPNLGINMTSFNIGAAYRLREPQPEFQEWEKTEIPRNLNVAIMIASGYNESESFLGREGRPFYTISTYVTRRQNLKSSINAGLDAFFTLVIKEDIKIDSTSNADYKRLGAFIGHELHINRISLLTQLGYHFYRKYPSFKSYYERIGIKYYLGKMAFLNLSLKAYGTKAESAEFGLGFTI